MGKHYSDRERLEAVKKYRTSGKSASAFALEEGYSRSTFKDWVSAYEHLQGEFIRIDNMEEKGGTLINEENVKMNVLKDDEVTKTSNHFSRFDHSVVVIETKQIKITTSLAQALKIVELIYDRL
ncbi:MAG: helix-turn-helix domain-containing protein [Candidatus Izemoplasmatales bacterium]|jgi:transposase-like protein